MTQVHEDRTNTEDHDYPFLGSKHLNPIGVNENHVRMSNRTRNDFDKINKLNPGKVPPSKTGYEAYKSGSESRTRTKGLFQNDPQRVGVVKTPAEYQVTDFKDLVGRNQLIRDHMSRQQRVEDKKLFGAKRQRVILDNEVTREMQHKEQKFKSAHAREIRSTWQTKPREH